MLGWLVFFAIIFMIWYAYRSFEDSIFGKLLGWVWKPFSYLNKVIPAPMANKAHVTVKQMPTRDDIGPGGCGVYTEKCW